MGLESMALNLLIYYFYLTRPDLWGEKVLAGCLEVGLLSLKGNSLGFWRCLIGVVQTIGKRVVGRRSIL